MVSLKFTCWEEFRAGRHQLEDKTYSNLEETVLQVASAFKENRQIYAELEYYGKHAQLLGEHPIFERYKALEKLRLLGPIQLAKKLNSTQKAIRDFKRKLKLNSEPILAQSRKQKLDFREWELEQITALIKAQQFG